MRTRVTLSCETDVQYVNLERISQNKIVHYLKVAKILLLYGYSICTIDNTQGEYSSKQFLVVANLFGINTIRVRRK